MYPAAPTPYFFKNCRVPHPHPHLHPNPNLHLCFIGEKYLEKKKKWITMYYGESYNAKTKIEESLAKLRKSRGT